MKNDPMKVKYNKGGDSMLGRSGYAEGGKEDERNRELATADKERATQIEYAEFANDNLALKIAQERSISQLNKDAAARQENEEAAAARLSETMLDENMDEAYDKAKRDPFVEGSMLVPPEMEQDTPVDTYPNIPEDEMAVAEESQLPDSEMETEHLEFVLNEALDIDEQEYLIGVLETDERLSGIFDKVMDVATEFSGEGEVDGPGTGVSDSIPARLSDGEFVFTKKATDQVGADQLQTMMDEAEKAYDGGLMKKAFGGLTNDPLSTEKKTSSYNSSNEIKKQMISANQMPSIR